MVLVCLAPLGTTARAATVTAGVIANGVKPLILTKLQDLDLGSVTLKELFAVQEAQANLRATPWLGFHLDVQDDGTREAEVARFAADVLFRVAKGVEIGVSGTPDVVKQEHPVLEPEDGGVILLLP